MKRRDEEPVRTILGRPGNNLQMGIVGLPNVGKSSLFNMLSNMSIPAENYPFCTIDPNTAIAPVPDQRFRWLCSVYNPASEVAPVLRITDIAGLVRGAHEGQGLGNAFLSHIRAVDGLYHVVRAFRDDNITHVEESVDPVRDIGIINDELRFKDLETCENFIHANETNVNRGVGGRDKKFEFDTIVKVRDYLVNNEHSAVRFGTWDPNEIDVLNRFQFLTAKEVTYLVNLSKRDYLRKGSSWLPLIKEKVDEEGGGLIIPLSVDFEQELFDMDEEARNTYLTEHPSHKSILPRVLKMGYKSLHLIHYFTAGADEVRAWTIRDGKSAPEAAGVIHTDFERGFICAEVMAYDDLKELGSEEEVKKAGKLRQQGKKYIVQDGDIIYFKFNV
jgi:obg-like ATPase 1